MKRIFFAFVVAAIWMPLVAAVASEDYFRIQAFALVALFSVTLTIIVAVPLFRFFREKSTLPICMAVGAGIGCFGTLIFMLRTDFKAALNWAPLLVGSGWISSILFYFIGVWRNQSLSTNSATKPFSMYE